MFSWVYELRVSCLFFADDESWNKITCYCQKPFAGEYCALVNLKSYEFYFSFPALFSFCAVLFVTSTERNFWIFETLPSRTRNSFMLYVQRCISWNHTTFCFTLGCRLFVLLDNFISYIYEANQSVITAKCERVVDDKNVNCLQNEQDDNFCTCMWNLEITCWWLSGFNFPSSFRSFGR